MRPICLVLALSACTRAVPPVVAAVVPEVEERPMNADAVAGVADPALARLLSDHWEHTLSHSPTWATSLGDHRFDDRLGDASIAASAAARRARDGFIVRAIALSDAALSAPDETTLALLLEGLQTDAASDVCRFEQWSLSPRSNPAVDFNALPMIQPVTSLEQSQALLARYRALPTYVDQRIEQLAAGHLQGWVANAETLSLVLEQLDTQLATPVADWPIAQVKLADDLALSDEVQAQMMQALSGPYRESLEGFSRFVREVLLPAARPAEQVGMGSLPDGAACYQARVRAYTTLPTPAHQVHQRGLDEMARIHDELQELGEAVYQTRDLQQIFDHLRTDDGLYFETSEQVMQVAEQALSDARGVIDQAFGRLPQAQCEVAAVPDNEAPYTTIAYYWPGSPDGARPGTYFVNTYQPHTRPRHEARVLAFHESIPGHHLQIAIAQELPDLPAFRRHAGMTAFVEGWGLYSERLADELGLYPTDVDRLGMLSFDAWRAARLVVDTGIHSQGWTREQAEAYMVENTPLADNNIVNEVDRYISWPAQALAYKTGQLHLLAERARAEEQLGDAFELRAFHDVVLGGGAVSLPELSRRIDAWLAAQGGP